MSKSQDTADRILALLDASGMSVNQLATLTGIARPTLDRHLKHAPKLLALGAVEDIAEVLGVSYEYLIGTEREQVAA